MLKETVEGCYWHHGHSRGKSTTTCKVFSENTTVSSFPHIRTKIDERKRYVNIHSNIYFKDISKPST